MAVIYAEVRSATQRTSEAGNDIVAPALVDTVGAGRSGNPIHDTLVRERFAVIVCGLVQIGLIGLLRDNNVFFGQAWMALLLNASLVFNWRVGAFLVRSKSAIDAAHLSSPAVRA